MVEPHSSNFIVTTTNVLDVRIFRKFKVKFAEEVWWGLIRPSLMGSNQAKFSGV